MQDIIVRYENKEVYAFRVLDHFHIDHKYYDELIKVNLTAQEAFDLLCNLYLKEPWIFTSNLPAQEEIRKHYQFINDFCFFHKIRYGYFNKLMLSNPDLSLFELLKKYLSYNDLSLGSYKDFYCGVSVDAICTKFSLSKNKYSKCNKEEPFEKSILALLLSNYPEKYHEIMSYVITMFIDKPRNEFKVFLESHSHLLEVCYYLFQLSKTNLGKDNIPVSFEEMFQQMLNNPDYYQKAILYIRNKVPNLSSKRKKKFLEKHSLCQEIWNCYLQYWAILAHLNVCYIVDFFENGWAQFYGKEISYLHQRNAKMKSFIKDYEALKKFAQDELLQYFSMTREQLQKCYEMLEEDYERVTIADKSVFVYRRTKIE